jgi:hypothetical protein
MEARCVMQPLRIDARIVEAMAAFWAVRFCKKVGFFEVILEGDTIQVVDEIRSPLPHLSKFGQLTESIVQKLHGLRSANLST